MQSLLQETYFTIRADRYVLPVKSSFKTKIEAVVCDASGWASVYIEPQALVNLGNRLQSPKARSWRRDTGILPR